ncbi:hypothetical protein SCA6_002598 [Theobroma cacao]
MIQLGRGISSSNNFCTGFSSMLAAWKKFKAKLNEGSISKFSHPSGNPASAHGNRNSAKRIESPDSMARSRVDLNRAAL